MSISKELQSKLSEQAKQAGLDAESYLQQLLEAQEQTSTYASLDRINKALVGFLRRCGVELGDTEFCYSQLVATPTSSDAISANLYRLCKDRVTSLHYKAIGHEQIVENIVNARSFSRLSSWLLCHYGDVLYETNEYLRNGAR